MSGALHNIRVLDFSRIWAGPHATKLLADADTGIVAPDTGIVQNHGAHTGANCQIAGVGTSVGAAHQHLAAGSFRDLGRRGREHEARA